MRTMLINFVWAVTIAVLWRMGYTSVAVGFAFYILALGQDKIMARRV